MPASMMMAVVAGWPKVIGSSSEMVATGPMPGSTPMAVPIRQPISAKVMFWKVSATPKPCARLVIKVSMVGQVPFGAALVGPRPDGHADVELADEDPPAQGEQEDRQSQDADRVGPVVRLRQRRGEDEGDDRHHHSGLLEKEGE